MFNNILAVTHTVVLQKGAFVVFRSNPPIVATALYEIQENPPVGQCLSKQNELTMLAL